MEFDKSRVYTALNADKLAIGSRVILRDTLSELKEAVEAEAEGAIQNLAIIHGEDMMFRFFGGKYHSSHLLAYLVEPPKEPQYRPFEDADEAVRVITAHGGWVKSKNSALQFIVVVKDQNLVTLSSGGIFDPQELFQHFCLADDDSPCGVPVEE